MRQQGEKARTTGFRGQGSGFRKDRKQKAESRKQGTALLTVIPAQAGTVIPAKAGIHVTNQTWIPASAGMTPLQSSPLPREPFPAFCFLLSLPSTLFFSV